LVKENSKAYFVNAYLSYIKTDDNTVYPACTGCKKKVVKDNTSTFICENCGISIDNPTWNFNLTTRIEDCTGTAYSRFLGS